MRVPVKTLRCFHSQHDSGFVPWQLVPCNSSTLRHLCPKWSFAFSYYYVLKYNIELAESFDTE